MNMLYCREFLFMGQELVSSGMLLYFRPDLMGSWEPGRPHNPKRNETQGSLAYLIGLSDTVMQICVFHQLLMMKMTMIRMF